LWIIIRIYYLYDSTKAFAIALGGMLTSVLSAVSTVSRRGAGRRRFRQSAALH